MFKVMILLKRAEGKTNAQFEQWWLVNHAPLARQLPGLNKATFNLVDSAEGNDFDGVSELWFESESAFQAAYASDIGKAVAADSMANVSARIRLPVVEHEIKP